MDGGSIEMLSVAGNVLAVLKLANPAAQMAAGGAVELNPISEEDAALARGQAATARILAADGNEIYPVRHRRREQRRGDQAQHDEIYRDGPVRIRSFTLAMP